MTEKKTHDLEEFGLDLDQDENPETGRRISIAAEVVAKGGRALDPQCHDAEVARDIALDLCGALSDSFGKHEKTRPETLAVAVQTVLETLISSIEREGVDAASMRVALANSMLVNGEASVTIDVDGQRVPSYIPELSGSIH